MQIEAPRTQIPDGQDVWVFGYGSLVWKVDFTYERRVVGYVEGFHRRFWQGSHDHRGTATSPGRVVTLVASNEYREKFGNVSEGDRCWGVAYLIHRDTARDVFGHLDHREKNGYSSEVVDVFGSDGSTLCSAAVYIATTENPAFLGPASTADIAHTLVHSVGPSGRNIDYFINLCHAVRIISANHADTHLVELEEAVRGLAGVDGVVIHDFEESARMDLQRLVDAGVVGLLSPPVPEQ
ncbi:hypothetical protein HDU78_010381 [Chytriomyces hyalinus]|nr:hypothetical protein HDU78_010381 [Chytriomyces hyalinus]